jgi:hypothetical protein
VEARTWVRSSAILPALALSSIALILLTGAYLALTLRAGTSGWIRVSLGAVFLVGFLGALAGTRMRALRKTAPNDSGASLDAYQRSVADAALQTPIRTRLTVALAIVLLMIARPAINTSLLIVGVALGAGLIWSSPTWRRGPVLQSEAGSRVRVSNQAENN